MPAYSKKQQLPKRTKKTAKERGQISPETYKAVMKRDRHKCIVCGRSYGLECHHVRTRGNGGTGTEDNCCMLCKNCHYVKLHGQGDYTTKRKVFEYMIKLGYDFVTDIIKLDIKNDQFKLGG